jgi:CheY-like chemotaxis protein
MVGWLVKRRRVAIANHKPSAIKDTNNRLLTISNNKIFQTTSHTSSEFVKKVPSVLIVNDEEDVLYAFEVILSSRKYHVNAFSGSKEALKHIVEQDNYSQYSLAIIDIRLPDINGIQLYQILKIINKKIEVLFVSALDAAEELTSLFPEIRTGDVIRKPVSQQDFIEKVDEILTSSTLDNSS